jgi:hypothetical protein
MARVKSTTCFMHLLHQLQIFGDLDFILIRFYLLSCWKENIKFHVFINP